MARVVAVHGIGAQFNGEFTVLNSFSAAMRSGLQLAGVTLQESDIGAAFFGDLFRRQGVMAGGESLLTACDLDMAADGPLLEALWEEASRVDSRVMPPTAATMARTPLLLQRALNALCQSPFFVRVTERALIFDLKQVSLYFRDEQIRERAQQRVAERITADTRVIVAHSMGSFVAYEALCAHPEWRVTTFVTLGSPLGIRNLIFDRLRPEPGLWPGGLQRWTNIADAGDIVALQKQLNPLFSGVRDVMVHNGAKAHDASPYLTAKETGEAIAEGL